MLFYTIRKKETLRKSIFNSDMSVCISNTLCSTSFICYLLICITAKDHKELCLTEPSVASWSGAAQMDAQSMLPSGERKGRCFSSRKTVHCYSKSRGSDKLMLLTTTRGQQSKYSRARKGTSIEWLVYTRNCGGAFSLCFLINPQQTSHGTLERRGH